MKKVKYMIVPIDEIVSGFDDTTTISFVFDNENLMTAIHEFLDVTGLDEDEIAIFEIAKEKKVSKTLSVVDTD